MALADEMSSRVQNVAGELGRSVVRVGNRWRGGSGVVIGEDTVLTNAHNVRAERLAVSFADGRTEEASLRGIDVDGDLAVLEVETAGLPAVAWAETTPEMGSTVLGVALTGRGAPRVTVGYVSAVERSFRGPRGRRVAGALEHTAPLAPGSSGGPLAGLDGRVVGINTSRVGDGFYLALPADETFRRRVDALSRGQDVVRPRLGIAITPPEAAGRLRRAVGLPERDGLLVRAVEEASAAEAAGIAEGDLIIAADGRPLARADDLHDLLGAMGNRTTIELRVERAGEERMVTVSLSTTPSTDAGPLH